MPVPNGRTKVLIDGETGFNALCVEMSDGSLRIAKDKTTGKYINPEQDSDTTFLLYYSPDPTPYGSTRIPPNTPPFTLSSDSLQTEENFDLQEIEVSWEVNEWAWDQQDNKATYMYVLKCLSVNLNDISGNNIIVEHDYQSPITYHLNVEDNGS